MNSSNLKKIQNEMLDIEEDSDRFIPSDNYYCINIYIPDLEIITEELSTKLLTKNTHHQPLVTYSFKKTIILLYSCVEDGQKHYMKGSHHNLISEYTSIMVKEFGKIVKCSIVELNSRICVLTYFSWKTHNNSKESIIDISNGKISLSDTRSKTFRELILTLKDNNIVWDEIPSDLKFGTFYKLKKRKGKLIISKLSESFDARESKKYNTFLFE